LAEGAAVGSEDGGPDEPELREAELGGDPKDPEA
jgi:hypothetical protein